MVRLIRFFNPEHEVSCRRFYTVDVNIVLLTLERAFGVLRFFRGSTICFSQHQNAVYKLAYLI